MSIKPKIPAPLSVAEEFFHAFELCYGNGLTSLDGKLHSAIPAVVNLTFAIELALKAIHLAHGTDSRGHKLKPLFDSLPAADREVIRGSCSCMEDRFDKELTLVSEAFVKWRYAHEKRGVMSIDLDFLKCLWFAVAGVAKQMRENERLALCKES